MALIGNTADVYGQTWHLPCDDNRLSYKFIAEIGRQWDEVKYKVLPWIVLKNRILFNHNLKETQELLPRYDR
jgi:hypothetical protein